MHLLYADDSGSVGDRSQDYFVLGGISVFERQPHWIAQKLDHIAEAFNPAEPQSIELHGNPMLKGSGVCRRFPREQRIAAFKAALQVFADSPRENRAFCVVIHKTFVIEQMARDPVEVAFEQLCSRFDQYLGRLHKHERNTQRGIIIFDKSKNETAIQRLATDFKIDGHTYGQVRNLAEVPVFIYSKASYLVQLADIIAYAVFLKFEHNNTEFFDVFSHRFDEFGGQRHGLYICSSP